MLSMLKKCYLLKINIKNTYNAKSKNYRSVVLEKGENGSNKVIGYIRTLLCSHKEGCIVGV